MSFTELAPNISDFLKITHTNGHTFFRKTILMLYCEFKISKHFYKKYFAMLKFLKQQKHIVTYSGENNPSEHFMTSINVHACCQVREIDC